MKKKIRFVIQHSGAPYPNECWWKIIGSNGRILVHSELMRIANAKKIINKIIDAVMADSYKIVETGAKKQNG